jgi:phosphate transport system protein
MTRIRFHEGLDELKQRLITTAGLAERALERAVRAYAERKPELCAEVFEYEDRINRNEREIDQLALDLLAMQQPMATDLRLILAVIKANGDLERVGDQAVNIAQRVVDIAALPAVELPVDIPRMGVLATEMIHRALDAFIHGDTVAAQRVLEMDDDVDALNHDAFIAINRKLQQAPFISQQCLDALIVARNLERIADHATNIAEDVIFWTSGEDVRHAFGSGKVTE